MTKIAVIHNSYLEMPAGSQPQDGGFNEEKALAYVQSNIDRQLENIHQAGTEKADIVVTHEDFTNAGAYGWARLKYPDLFKSLVLKTTSSIIERMGAAAKKYSMMIAANHYECAEGKLYNTSFLYGRNGEIIGRYKKVHLPSAERWGVTAGDEYPVYKTDIGNIGFITCYDIYFPEACRALALNGADIVIHQTQGWGWSAKTPDGCGGILGEAYMRTRAAENSVYLITSKVVQNGGKDGGRSVVLDNNGRILADSGTSEEKILYAEIDEFDFDYKDEYAYNSLYSGIPALRPVFMLSRRPDTYGVFIEESPEIIKRYPGLRFKDGPGEPEEILKSFNALPDDEKKKYHW